MLQLQTGNGGHTTVRGRSNAFQDDRFEALPIDYLDAAIVDCDVGDVIVHRVGEGQFRVRGL